METEDNTKTETIVTASNSFVDKEKDSLVETIGSDVVIRVHGGKGSIEEIVNSVESLSESDVDVQLDLPGEEKVRILRPEKIDTKKEDLEEGQTVYWVPKEKLESYSQILNYVFATEKFPSNLEKGDPFLVSDAQLQFVVSEVGKYGLKLTLEKKSISGVKTLFPGLGCVCPIKSLSETSIEKTIGKKGEEILGNLKDKGLLDKVSQFAFSFVETPEDIDEIVHYMKDLGINFDKSKIVLKLETLNAVEKNIDEIIDKILKLKESGITIIPEIARGDLGVACSYAGRDLYEVQDGVVEKFDEKDIKYIVATGVFSSVTNAFKFRNELREFGFTDAQLDDFSNGIFASNGEWDRFIQIYPNVVDYRDKIQKVFQSYVKKGLSLKMDNRERKQMIKELKNKNNLAGYMLAQEGIMAENRENMDYLLKEFNKTRDLILRYLENYKFQMI